MMKKFLTGVLALALSGALAVPVLADTTVNPGEDGSPSPSAGTTTVSFHVDPAYTVTIPAAVQLDKVEGEKVTYEKDMTVTASAGLRLLKNQTIQVTLDGEFTMTSPEGAELPYTVTAGGRPVQEGGVVASFGTSDAAQSSTLRFAAEDPEFAGQYSGTVTFTLRVQNGQ